MRRVVGFLLLAVMVGVSAVLPGGAARAQGLNPVNACAIDGQADLFARYEWRNQRVVLVSWSTGEVVRVVENNLDAPRFEVVTRSPDCRYLVAEIGGTGTVVWDVLTSARVAVLPGLASSEYVGSFLWSPTSKYALLRDSAGTAHIWDTHHGTLTPLIVQIGPFRRVGWDLSRQQVLIVPISAENTLAAYDLQTGGQVAVYHTAATARSLNWSISRDGSLIVLLGNPWLDDPPYGLSVWNRDTMASVHLNAGLIVSSLPPRIALSPDNRYLAVGRANNVSVWDLQHIAPNIEDRRPFFSFGCAWNECHNFTEVRFVDDSMLEVIEERTGNARRWDMHTSRGVPAE